MHGCDEDEVNQAAQLKVGDYVRFDNQRYGVWAHGWLREIMDAEPSGDGRVALIHVVATGGWGGSGCNCGQNGCCVPPPVGIDHWFGSGDQSTIRRIRRPIGGSCDAQLTALTDTLVAKAKVRSVTFMKVEPTIVRDLSVQHAVHIDGARDSTGQIKWKVRKPTPADPLHDGMATMGCYRRWCDNRALLERGGRVMYVLTPAQIAAGRAAYLSDALNEHSAQLRLKVAASDAARRASEPSVLAEDDEAWLANCKDMP